MRQKTIGEELVESLTQARDLLRAGRSEKLSARQVRRVPPPREYAPAEVRVLRGKLHVSQAIFADIVGVSTVLVQAWEQGKRKPSRLACRLFDSMSGNMPAWKRLLAA